MRALSWLTLATLLSAALAACSSQAANVSTSASSSAINCGQASAVETDPSDAALHGVRIGPIFVPTSADASGRAVIRNFQQGQPTRVVIDPLQPLSAAIRLEGWRCATGERLRLAYGGQATVAAALLPYASGAEAGATGYSGQMLFTAPGEWMIAVSSKTGHLLGRGVVTVQAQS